MFELVLDILALVSKIALVFLFFYMLIRSWPLETSVTDEGVCEWIEETPSPFASMETKNFKATGEWGQYGYTHRQSNYD